MTVITVTNTVTYTSDGVQTVYAYDFLILDESHLQLYDVDQLTGQNVLIDQGLYTVTGVDDPEGGTVELTDPIANGNLLVIIREVPVTQLLDYVPYDEFPAESHEGALDKLTMICQQLEARFGQVAVYPPGVSPPEAAFPPPGARGGFNIEFSEDGTQMVAVYNTAEEWAENPVGVPVYETVDGFSALHHSDKSRQWAVNPEDIPVAGTNPAQYSAMHWAIKASKVETNSTMVWSGKWLVGTVYEKNEVVTDGSWLMIANKQTSDRPAPQPIGIPGSTFPVAPVFSDLSFTGQVVSGSTYTFTAPGWVTELSAWVPEVSGTTTYSFLIINQTDPANPIVSVVDRPILEPNEWATIALTKSLIVPGTVYSILMISQNVGGTTQVTGGWSFGGQDNTGAPAAQGWNHNNANTLIRIDKTDLDSTDRTTELLGLVPGTDIRFAETAAPANYRLYTVTAAPVDQGTYIQMAVNGLGNVGTITIGVATTMTADVPIAQPTLYSQENDYWLAQSQPDWATVVGYKELDGVPQSGVDNHAFGIDVKFQEADVSEDWDFMATSAASEGGGSGGGGQPLGSVVDVVTLPGDYTVVDTDVGKVLNVNSATPVTITLNSGALIKNNVFHVVQAGAGQVTVSGSATINAFGITPVTEGQYAMLTFTMITDSEALCQGQGVPL